ncbi:hypothetical protein QYZ43_24175 [Vibrio parahaemolyticus]|nr:hypothetical protein [Vibrio parahaemolyticus]MDN4715994.1 hypothetical protein [Vibrio parahaemolyticus]MDN4719982.1 hypothetical protein [Vibrio parahaemolyticus]
MAEINRGKKEQEINKHLNGLFDDRYTEELKVQRKKKSIFIKSVLMSLMRLLILQKQQQVVYQPNQILLNYILKMLLL